MRIAGGQLKAGVVLAYVVMAIQASVGLVYTPVVLRALGQAEYGLYTMVASIISYLGLLSFGFGGAYVRFHSRYAEEGDSELVRTLNGVFLVVFVSLGLVALGLGLLLALNIEFVLGRGFTGDEIALARVLAVILTLNVFQNLVATVFNSYIFAYERFVVQKVVALVQSVVSPLAVLPVLLAGYGAIGMAMATTLVTMLTSAYLAVYALRRLEMRFGFRGMRWSLLREVSVFSGYIFLYMVVDQINWNVDKFIVGRIRGPVEVAIFGVAALLNVYYMNTAGAISSVFAPRVNRIVAAGKDQSELLDLFIRVGRIQLIVMGLLLSGLVVFGRPFLEMWAGEGYVGAYPILLLLVIPVTLPLVQGVGVEIQKAMNLHAFRALVYAAVALANVTISVPLVMSFGGVGAAAATAASILIGNVGIMNWYYRVRVGLDVKRFWGRICRLVPGFLVPASLGFVLMVWWEPQGPLALALSITGYSLVYAASLWAFGLDDEEKRLFRDPFRRLLRRS